MVYAAEPIPHYVWIDNPQCVAGYSTRLGGLSEGVYACMNTGLHSKDNPDVVRKNRDMFFKATAPGLAVKNLHQIHSAKVVRVDSHFVNDTEADGFYTTEKGLVLSISIADCGSVLFHDDAFSIIGGLHCGWKGTRDGVIQALVKELCQFTQPERLTAYIGPMIQKDNYEVGNEFYDYFPHEFLEKRNGSLYLDLNGRVESLLRKLHIGTIHNANMDTFSNPEMFFSYRRDGITGRMCSYIGLKND